MAKDVKVIVFLDKDYFNQIKNYILSDEFPWYYNDHFE